MGLSQNISILKVNDILEITGIETTKIKSSPMTSQEFI